MTSLEATLRRIRGDLTGASVPFALVGGLAVSARTEPRFTRDVDLAVTVADDSEAERLIRALRSRGYGIHAIVEQSAAGRLATARLTIGDAVHLPVVDLLFASSGIEPEVVANAEPLELLPALSLPVAGIGHLIALKLLSRDDVERPQDQADLRALRRVATRADLVTARESAALVTARGYNRGRDLEAELERLVRG